MVDFLGTIVTAALMVIVNALTVYLDIGCSAKLALAAAAGLWIGLAAAASASGSAAMQQLSWSFVPTMLVPFWLIVHAVIWAPLRGHTRFSHSANALA